MVEFRLFHYSSVSLSAVINYYGLDRRGISSAPTARGTTFTKFCGAFPRRKVGPQQLQSGDYRLV